MWAPRSLNQQPVSDSKRVRTAPVQRWSVPEQSVVVVEPGSCSQRNRRRSRRRWSDLVDVHAQSTLCSSKRQSSSPPSPVHAPSVSPGVSLSSKRQSTLSRWLTCQDNLLASQRRQEERSSEKVKCKWMRRA